MKRSLLFSRLAITALCVTGWSLHAAAPEAARQNGYTVMVEIKANEAGEPESMSVLQSEDHSQGEILTKMALAMAAKTKFPPHLKDGKPVKFIVRAPFFFPIEDDEGASANDAPRPLGKSGESIQPNYPPEMLARNEVGGVIFEMIIDTQGNLARLTTMRASHPEFEKAARSAVETWKFIPAQKDGKPVESRWRIAIVFETSDKMADLKWRIAPRPSLGSFVVLHDNTPPQTESEQPAQAPATTPAPTPAPGK